MLLKRCPECNRTYSDEGLSFCLADGALLSAPYDPQATEQFTVPRETDPPPTEVLPQTPRTAEPVRPTIESPFVPAALKPEKARSLHDEQKPNRLPLLIIGGILLLAASVIFIMGFNSRNRETEKTASTSDSGTTGLTNTPASDVNSPTNLSPANNTKNSNASRISADNSNAATRDKAEESGTADGNKIFRANEVDQKAFILSKPQPEYTEEARKNQVSGTVVLQVVLSSSGSVTGVRALSGLPYGLTEKAMAAAREVRFRPAMKDGQPVSQYMKIEYNFNIY